MAGSFRRLGKKLQEALMAPAEDPRQPEEVRRDAGGALHPPDAGREQRRSIAVDRAFEYLKSQSEIENAS